MNVLILHPNNSEAKISKGSSILIIHPNNLDCKISKVSNILIIHPNNLECKISKKSNILIIHPNNSKLQISKTQNILINLLGGGHILEHWCSPTHKVDIKKDMQTKTLSSLVCSKYIKNTIRMCFWG